MQTWKIITIKDNADCEWRKEIVEFEKFGKKVIRACKHADSKKHGKCTKAKCPLRHSPRKLSYAYKSEQDGIAQKHGYNDAVEAMPGLYNSGWSISEIANEFCVTWQTIHLRLKALEVKLRKRGGPNMKKIVLTKGMYQDIMSTDDTNKKTGLRCGISAPSVAKIKRGYVPEIKVDSV